MPFRALPPFFKKWQCWAQMSWTQTEPSVVEIMEMTFGFLSTSVSSDSGWRCFVVGWLSDLWVAEIHGSTRLRFSEVRLSNWVITAVAEVASSFTKGQGECVYWLFPPLQFLNSIHIPITADRDVKEKWPWPGPVRACCVLKDIWLYYTDHEITYLSSRDEVLSSIFLLDVLRREGQEESSFTKQTKEQKVRKHLPLNEINRRLSRSGWLLLRNNFLPGFLFKFPAWNGKSFFSSRGFYLITLALGKSMGRGTKGRRVTPNRLLVTVEGHLVKFHRHLKHHRFFPKWWCKNKGNPPDFREIWVGELLWFEFTEAAEPKDEDALKRWLGDKLAVSKIWFFKKWTNCYLWAGLRKKWEKRFFFVLVIETFVWWHVDVANCIHTYQKLPLELGWEWRKLQPLGFKKRRLPSQCNWKIEKVLQGLQFYQQKP